MRNGHRILDLDRHVIEPIEMWPQYLERRFHEFAPRLTGRSGASQTWEERFSNLGEFALWQTPPEMTVAGRPIIDVPERAAIIAAEQGSRRGAHIAPTMTGDAHLQAMQQAGIDIGVLVPSYALYLAYNDNFDVELTRVFAKAYNRWILDYCSVDPQRMRPAALISRQAPEFMQADLLEALNQGFRSVVLRPNPICGRTISDPGLLPFYAACAANSIPVLFHEGSHSQVTTVGADRYATRFGKHACSHPMEAMMALLSLIEAGVLELNPRLRVGFLEAGCTWLPHWLWRLDQVEYMHMQNELQVPLSMPPSDYVRRQCWFAFEPGEALLRETLKHVSPRQFVFGSDYPHVDHQLDVTTELDHLQAHISGEAYRRLLWDNAATLLDLSAKDEPT